MNALERIHQHCEQHLAKYIHSLVEFVQIPNDVFHPRQIQENAAFLKDALEQRGIQVTLWDTGHGRPFVYGHLPANTTSHVAQAKTLLIYGHYDGVPVQQEAWHSDPYRPVLRSTLPSSSDGWSQTIQPRQSHYCKDWRLFGRSVADSKNAIVAILSSIDALQDLGIYRQVNLKFLFDGSEQIESPGLTDVLLQYREDLRADVCISASGEMHQSGLPTVELGVRGMLQFNATVYTTSTEMHSGHFGNVAPNAVLQ